MPVLPSYRNQLIDFHSKPIDWFLYENNTGTQWVKFDQWSVNYILFSCGAYNLFDGTPTVNGLYQKDPPGYPEFQEYILEESTNDDLSSYYKDRAIALTLDNENGAKKTKPVLWYSNQVAFFKYTYRTIAKQLIPRWKKVLLRINTGDFRATMYVILIKNLSNWFVLEINFFMMRM